ncbi:MAG: hypothetical protein B6D41_12210, partial [Chloroflexi bacterium UTCFX4]
VMPFSPISRISSPVLVIVPPDLFRDTQQHRASVNALRDVALGGNNGKSETSFGANRPQERKTKKRAPRVTHANAKRSARDPRARQHGRDSNE